MDQNTFMGLLIGALVVLFGLASVIVALIVRPVLNLNKNLTELNINIKSLTKDTETLQTRVSKHGEQLDKTMITVERHDEMLKSHDRDISYLKKTKIGD